MSIYLQDMQKEVLSELGDPDGDFFEIGAGKEIDRWINYAIQLFCRKTKLLKTTTDYSWSASTQEVAISTVITASRPHLEWATWVQSTTGVVPTFMSQLEIWEREPDRHVTSGDEEDTPTRLYINIHTDKIGLHPTPDTAGTLTAYYSYEPADLDSTASATSAIDSDLERWWLDICQYAVYRGKKKDVDRYSMQEAREALAQFNYAIGEARLDLAKRSQTGLIIPFIQDYEDP